MVTDTKSKDMSAELAWCDQEHDTNTMIMQRP